MKDTMEMYISFSGGGVSATPKLSFEDSPAQQIAGGGSGEGVSSLEYEASTFVEGVFLDLAIRDIAGAKAAQEAFEMRQKAVLDAF
jgi:hypothetical protein